MITALIPPVLPRFLAVMFDLKVIEGVPNSEEVKLIHAVIRSLNEVINVPGLYDADLAIELSQYLFSIQMEIYRDKYPCSIFPSSTTYIPPQLPAHIPAVLKLVTNAPSNDQIKAVQAALRLSENLANVPSMFNADLSMELSQHLFDIQFERYLRKITSREHAVQVAGPQHNLPITNESQGAPDMENSVSIENAQNIGHHDTITSGQASLTLTPDPELPVTAIPSVENHSSETRQEDLKVILSRLCDGIEGIKQTMVGTQHCIARGINSAFCGGSYMRYSYALVNSKGESPEAAGLPSPPDPYNKTDSWPSGDQTVARYLRFYDIGEEFVSQDEETLSIKEGNAQTARQALRAYIGL